MLEGLATALKWLLLRLPWPFSVSFGVISILWALLGFHYTHHLAVEVLNLLPKSWKEAAPTNPWLTDLKSLVYAVTTLLSFIVGFVVAYDISAFTNLVFSKLLSKRLKYPAGFFSVPWDPHTPSAPFAKSTRIGIVLAGGGAKGSYQAGAMKAIYKFLESHHALGNVKVISSTSIGSWNAMFWLAGMIKSPKGWNEQGCLEWWWKRLKARHLVAPRFFAPSFSNAFLSSEPWQGQFDQMFGSNAVKRTLFETDIHFYMTRSNVRAARLECATNNLTPPFVNRVTYQCLRASESIDEFFSLLRTGVFASMDLPPLFPYMECNDGLYEDGGVIDNLPLSFPAAENCNIIFVLPLNSDFEEEPNNWSITGRIRRVMNVQQGALERNGFKLLYLYNENAALRHRVKQLSGNTGQHEAVEDREKEPAHRQRPLKYAMQRKHQEIRIFAVCPDKSFVKATIDTIDLWNTKGANVAFDVMYRATADMLAEFDFAAPQKGAHVAMIRRSGTHVLDHDF
jgi:predicted acylesterase/phospholipase RssA